MAARDNRLFVEVVLYRYRASIPWRDLPERFRDRLSTNIHAVVDALGNPIGVFLTGGQAHDLVAPITFCPQWQPTC